MNNLNICIAGLGNVGSALINSIEENNKYFNSKSFLNIKIIGISGKTKSKKEILIFKIINGITIL